MPALSLGGDVQRGARQRRMPQVVLQHLDRRAGSHRMGTDVGIRTANKMPVMLFSNVASK